jgi:uncharacterized membrane protein
MLLLQAPPIHFADLLLTAFTGLRWLGLLLAFFAYFVLGGLWFTQLFPKAYGAAMGKANVVKETASSAYIIGPGLCVLVITLTLALLLQALRVESYGGALLFGLTVGLGCVVATTVNNAINPNTPRPYLYALITGGYHLVGILAGCLILTALR